MNSKAGYRISIALLACLTMASESPAGQVDEQIQALRQQLEALTFRLDELERSNHELRSANAELQQASKTHAVALAQVDEQSTALAAQMDSRPATWVDRLRWQGDFRYRYENLREEGASTRKRNRIRARAGLIADINPELAVGFGLASGSSDPVSSNQTLGGGGSTKNIGLDLAYFDWSGLENAHVVGGKFKQIAYSAAANQLLWDSDWRPEGAGITWDNGRFFATGLGNWLESDSRIGSEFAWIAQAGVHLGVGDGAGLTAGLGYHQFDAKGRGPLLGDGDFFGNSFDPVTGTYLYNYRGVQVFAELGMKLFDMPLKLYGEYVQNQDAPVHDTAYIAGFKLGSAREPGSWDLSWAYEDLEADAALGLLTDSDFGIGGTDARGHVISGSYAIRKNFTSKLSWYDTEVGGDLGEPVDYRRMQLDLSFKY